MSTRIFCVGAVLWDVVGHTSATLKRGYDVGGHIRRIPGGVAFNIAMTIAAMGERPSLLGAVGVDDAGNELLHRCREIGIDVDDVLRLNDLPTDSYMAIEDAKGVVAAIADAHTLEKAGTDILHPLIAYCETHDDPIVLIDGNLNEETLLYVAEHPSLQHVDLRAAPASPGKALRLKSLFGHQKLTLYINKIEAEIFIGTKFTDAHCAATAMRELGLSRVVVTDGPHGVCDNGHVGIHSFTPPKLTVKRLTGAGDTFMAAHLISEMRRYTPERSIEAATLAAAQYVAGKTPEII